MTELYTTSKGSTYQCDISNCIEIQFKEYVWSFSISDFLLFRKTVNAVDLKRFIYNLSDECDFVSLHYVKISSVITLTLCDLIQLRDLVDGTKFSLELVSMIHEVLGDYEVV